MKIRSFKQKIGLAVGFLIFISTSIITTYSIISRRSQDILNAKSEIETAAHWQSSELEAKINSKFQKLRVFRNFFLTQEHLGIFSREATLEIFKRFLRENKDILAIFSQTDPNALDRKDAYYAHKDWYNASGVFIPYVFRDEKGEIHIVPIIEAEVAEIIKIHRKNKREVFMDPYFYDVGSKKVLMVTALVPYIKNDIFIGEDGVDFPITFMQNEAEQLSKKIYNGQSAVSIISAQGFFAANTAHKERVGKNISDYFSQNKVKEILETKKSKIFFQKDSLIVQYPINFGKTAKPWFINISIPQKVIYTKANHNIFILILIGSFMLLISILIMILLVARLTNPILQAAHKAQVIAGGDLSQTINIKRNDEIGIFIDSFNSMVAKLQTIILSIKQGAQNLNHKSDDIFQNVEKIAQGSNEQAVTTEEISASMEEILATISSNSEKAELTESISSKSAKELEESYNVIKRSIDLVQEISTKITVISEIANKTDILSINASIEAARSGAAGSGFAVVAQEIKKLANKTKAASVGIEKLSAEGNSISEIAGEKLKNLLPEIIKSSEFVSEIVNANKEQISSVSMISTSIQELASTTNQNTLLTEELSEASNELLAQAQDLEKIIAVFRLKADKDRNNTQRNKEEQRNKKTEQTKQTNDRLVNKEAKKNKENNVMIDLDKNDDLDAEFTDFD